MTTFEELTRLLDSHPEKTLGRGASEDEIGTAEKTIGVSIVGAYRDFLVRFGWGGVGHLELYGLGADVPRYLHLVVITQSERHEMEPPLPHHLIPVMNDGGGNLYCLDTKAEGPPIVLWDHTLGRDQQPEMCAAGFTEWLEQQIEKL